MLSNNLESALPIAILGMGLYVKDSRIPGAGQGLYTSVAWTEGETIIEYTGKILRTSEALR